MATEPVPLTELERDLPSPPDGWSAELDRRGVAVVADDLGRAAVDRATARALFSEHRENEARQARKRAEVERRVLAADEAFRAALPQGIPAGVIPEGLTGAQLLMLSDPMPGSRRESMVEHALANPGGSITYHPIRAEQADQ